MQPERHVPVMPREVLEALNLRGTGRYVDGTLGEGGHSSLILEKSGPSGSLLGLDRDSSSLQRARARLAAYGERARLEHCGYEEIGDALAAAGWEDGADGILLDLGMSSAQVDDAARGFSFMTEGPLDMRMDTTVPPTAADLVNFSSESELVRILRDFGEERSARRIARKLIAEREKGEIRTTAELASLVERAGVRGRPGHHPATRTFQALRIAVNDELGRLSRFLEDGWRWLRPGGRLVVISYHSLEDRMVKRALRQWAAECLCPPRRPICDCGWSRKVRLVNRRLMTPTSDEVAANARARSAGLRVVERLSAVDNSHD